ncbi:Crp/Fnr family transcriptional regulator [Sphingobacterium cellulitidis]|uniref:Crp/Fnr family transcriptional regulator n=1 Tax=Sphingobacterium cellulitidis TaxID=1768011 RepID=UPI0015C63304|nr:Crp/Fnr family transcriptional regulator [Sphingobacterium cellulitidis]
MKIKEIITLSQDEEINISKYWKLKAINKNEFLLRNGDVCKYDNYIVEGSFKAFRINEETGKEEIIFLAIEDWWASDLESFSNQTDSYFNIQALENSKVLQISKISFDNMLEKIPKMEKFFRIILQNYLTTIQKRFLTYNSNNAEKRYLEFISQYSKLNERMPQYLIASFLGITPEFLSILKKKINKS